MKKKILFIVSEDWYFISHRLQLALSAKKKGYEVILLSKDTGKFNQINNLGIECYNISWNRKILSPISLFKNVAFIKNKVKQIKPDIIHFISLLPILLGLLATIFNKDSKIILSITGLGTIFIKNNFQIIILRIFVKFFLMFSFRRKKLSVIVQNKDDLEYCKNKLICPDHKIYIIRGSGIDINFHSYQSEPNSDPIVLAFVGRFLEDKGVKVLIQAFEISLKSNSNLRLILAGDIDRYNPSSITENYLNKVLKNNKIIWLKNVKDIRKVWKKAHLAILPSRREGLPKSLLEAAANGRAMISTDVPGCREIAIHNENAILVPIDDVEKLSLAINFLSKNNKIRKKYGFKSRKIVESDMSEENVISNTLSVYEK